MYLVLKAMNFEINFINPVLQLYTVAVINLNSQKKKNKYIDTSKVIVDLKKAIIKAKNT